MTINKFTGNSKEEAIEKAKEAFGSSAVIMNVKEIKPKGFFGMFKSSTYEVTAAMDEKQQARPTGIIDIRADEKIPLPPLKPVNQASFEAAFDKKMDLNEEKSKKPETSEKSSDEAENTKACSEKERLDSLAAMVEGFEKPVLKSQNGDELKFVRILYRTLLDNDVNEKYINQILEEIEKFLRPGNSMDVILSNVYQKLILRFGQPDTIKLTPGKTKVVFFVGPTGVGKTTTIAKIASKFKVEHDKKIAFITADTYRIAATEQLRTYANILDAPMSVIYSKEELNDAIEKHEQADVIFVDTAGFSHKNEEQKSDIKNLIAGIEPDYDKSVYLVVSATTKYNDLKAIVDAYGKIAEYKLIFTKLDETSSYGNLLNIKLYSGANISYATDGQNVPDDIEVFDTQKIVKQLLGGRI